MTDGLICPKCGAQSPSGTSHDTCVHQSEGTFYGIEAHLVSMGWKCCKCGYEWGFDPEPGVTERR